MKKSICKLCGNPHSTWEPHVFSTPNPLAAAPVTELQPSGKPPKAPVTPSRVTESRVTVKHCPTCTCEEKRVYKTRAERQAAYRERKRAKVEQKKAPPLTPRRIIGEEE